MDKQFENVVVTAVETQEQAADLVETLKGKGPFTVFAPTDKAFGKLPEGTVENLLKPENKKKLAAILTYHVVPGKVMAADVAGLTSAKSVQGEELRIDTSDGVKVNDAKVIKTDIAASNGGQRPVPSRICVLSLGQDALTAEGSGDAERGQVILTAPNDMKFIVAGPDIGPQSVYQIPSQTFIGQQIGQQNRQPKQASLPFFRRHATPSGQPHRQPDKIGRG